VTVRIEQHDTTSYWADYGKLSFAQTWYYPVTAMANIWTSSFTSRGLLNETHWYSSPHFERTQFLLRSAKASVEESTLARNLQELQKRQFDESGHLNFGTYDYLDGVADKVPGLTPSNYLFCSGCNLRKAWIAG
jgi:hypothetical protein